MNRRSLITRLVVALFALTLISGVVYAQDAAAKPAAKTEKPHGRTGCRFARYQLGYQGTARCPAGYWRSVLPEDHRRASVCQEDRLGAEEGHSFCNVQKNQGSDHR